MREFEGGLRSHVPSLLPGGLHKWADGEGISIDEVHGDIFEASYLPRDSFPLNTREMTAALTRYSFLSDLMTSLPDHDVLVLVNRLHDVTSTNDHVKFAISPRFNLKRFLKLPFMQTPEEKLVNKNMEAMEAIFIHEDTSDLGGELERDKIKISELPKLLNNDAIYSLLDGMLDNRDKYRFQIGALLTQLTLTELPDNIKEELKTVTSDYEFRIELGHDFWYLCPEAETRLLTSLRNNSLLLVNEKLLTKFKGKLSAICLDTFSTEDGQTFVEGNWYSPTEKKLRNQIRTAFDKGTSRVELQKGTWALMRPITDTQNKNAETILKSAKRKAENLPEILPPFIGKRTRKAYRERAEEID